jgi:hypothetical protein
VALFRRRRDFVLGRLAEMGLEAQTPEGAFYVFIPIARFGMDSLTFCTRMLREAGVALVPGCYFGTEGYMRLSYCYGDETLAEGLRRVERFIRSPLKPRRRRTEGLSLRLGEGFFKNPQERPEGPGESFALPRPFRVENRRAPPKNAARLFPPGAALSGARSSAPQAKTTCTSSM